MGKFGQLFDRWLGRASGLYTFWALAPSSTVAVLSAVLSGSVGWIAALGPFGWFSAGLAGFFLSAVGFAAISRTKLWRLEATRQARISGESSHFDPMARVYENKRIYLRDLAPIGRRYVANKRFIDCEILGPGTAILGLRSDEQKPWPKMSNCNSHDVDVIQIDPSSKSNLAIRFYDCDFENCNFYHMTLLFWERENETLNWITPDYRQLNLLTDQSGEENQNGK